jgi:hypothetical protein
LRLQRRPRKRKATAKKPRRARLLTPPKVATAKLLLLQQKLKAAPLPRRVVRAAQNLQLRPREAASSSHSKKRKPAPKRAGFFMQSRSA